MKTRSDFFKEETAHEYEASHLNGWNSDDPDAAGVFEDESREDEELEKDNLVDENVFDDLPDAEFESTDDLDDNHAHEHLPAPLTELPDTSSGPKYPHVVVKLVGEDGNVFAIIGRVQAAMKGHLPKDIIDRYVNGCFSSESYDAVLQLTMRLVTVK